MPATVEPTLEPLGSTATIWAVSSGAVIGYNWQFNTNWVLGIEADIQGSAQRRSDNAIIAGTLFTVDQKLPWFATARGRLGYAAGPWLVYVTGGAA